MKQLKKSLAIILSVIVALSIMTVAASAKDKILVWEEFDEFVYGGELKYGNNDFDRLGKFAYGITAEEEGIYAINFSIIDSGDEYGYSMSLSESVVDENPVGFCYPADTEEYGTIYHFDKGERRYFGLVLEGEINLYNIEVLYLGKATDLSFSSLNLQKNVDIMCYDSDDGRTCDIYTTVNVTTDKNNEFSVEYINIPFDGQSLESGEMKIDVDFMGLKKNVTINVFSALDYIKAIRPNKQYIAPVVIFDDEGYIDDIISDEYSYAVDFELVDGTIISNDFQNYPMSFTTSDGKIVKLYPEVTRGSDGKTYWTVVVDDDVIVISEVSVSGNDQLDKPDDHKGFSFKSVFKKIISFYKKVFSFFKSIFR